MKHSIAILETSNVDAMTTDENGALFEKVSPAMRGSFARDVVSEYRRWVLGQIANASRSGATDHLQEMEKLRGWSS